LENAKFNRFRSIFARLVNIAAFSCIAGFIANIPMPPRYPGSPEEQGKSNTSRLDSPIILLSATIAEVQSTKSSIINESEVKTEAEEQRPEKTQSISDNDSNQKSDDSEINNESNIESSTGNNTENSIESNTEISNEQPEEAEKWESIEMRVTAYCPCPRCCGEYSDGITACGHEIQPGDTFLAADRRYPFGTEMLIPGYSNSQPVKVLDRGGAIKGNRLDVFFATHEEALEWGVQYLEVKVRKKPVTKHHK